MTPSQVSALQWAGITPPAMGMRTTCPRCSPHRIKRDDPCLRIKVTDMGLHCICKHCRDEFEVPL